MTKVETDISVWHGYATMIEYTDSKIIYYIARTDDGEPTLQQATNFEAAAIRQALNDVFITHEIDEGGNLVIFTDMVFKNYYTNIIKQFAIEHKYDDYRLLEYVRGNKYLIRYIRVNNATEADTAATLIRVSKSDIEGSYTIEPISITEDDDKWLVTFADAKTSVSDTALFKTIYDKVKRNYFNCTCRLVLRAPCKHALSAARNLDLWWWHVALQLQDEIQNLKYLPMKSIGKASISYFKKIVVPVYKNNKVGVN